MIEGLLSLLGSSAVGSLLGGVFAIFNRKHELAMKKADQEHERGGWAHQLQVKDKDIAYAREEAQGRKEVAIVEGEATIEAARMGALAQAHAADTLTAEELRAAGKWRGVLVLADGFRRFIRPAATVALTATALWLSLELIGMLKSSGWAAFTPEQKIDLGKMALNWVFCQAGAALGYWFVSRGNSR